MAPPVAPCVGCKTHTVNLKKENISFKKNNNFPKVFIVKKHFIRCFSVAIILITQSKQEKCNKKGEGKKREEERFLILCFKKKDSEEIFILVTNTGLCEEADTLMGKFYLKYYYS